MEVKYDSASPEDIAPIVDMKIEMFREFGYDQYLHENAREIIFEDYSRLYEANLAAHFLAKVDNRIVGIVGAFIKSYRNHGISMKLNREALNWLRDYGVSFVRLLASDAGRPIYERLGFSPDVDMVLKFET